MTGTTKQLERAASRGAVGLKSTMAYHRTLRYEQVAPEQAAEAFGKRGIELTASQIKAFEDFVFWRLCELSAEHVLPFQVHTGVALERSNPSHLENVIAAKPARVYLRRFPMRLLRVSSGMNSRRSTEAPEWTIQKIEQMLTHTRWPMILPTRGLQY